ncbi:hypothetical protein GGR56DRAFT_687247 [Xylariaceae sp. FL0804]|nr:hypothetical protein GGR56DRAFT_687247 [Xylariaceae sp. FL0804]
MAYLNATKWEPMSVLQLDNLDAMGVTCVGTAPCKDRRCQNRVGDANYRKVILGFLSSTAPSRTLDSGNLERAAESMLCHLHQHQLPRVVSKWRGLLEEHITEREQHHRDNETTLQDDTTGQDEVEELRKPEELRKAKAANRRRRADKYQACDAFVAKRDGPMVQFKRQAADNQAWTMR